MVADVKLPSGYEIRELSAEEFEPLWTKHSEKIFSENCQIFRFFRFLSDEQKARFRELGQAFASPYALNLAVYHGNDFVGWSCGYQQSAETFYMQNSAILPEHRRRGLYNALLAITVKTVTKKGFQKIYSRHNATNNDVIIPKLKYGFTISSLEISDMFGALVHLVYFPHELRRKVMIYRTGDIKPDEELKKALDI